MIISVNKCTDIVALLDLRREVIEAVFGCGPDAALMEANRAYYESALTDGRHIAVTASVDGKICGCAGMCLERELPSPENISGRCAYIMNVYVRPDYRRHGAARAMLNNLVALARSRDCGKIYLESTPEATPFYKSCGFSDMKQMMLYDSAQR